MATTIKQTEAIPASYPNGLGDHVWQRIEAYVAHRWTEREVIWTVEGPGEWSPPLTPATIDTVEVWNGTGWETCTAPDAPLGGFWLAGEGPYRFTATVGGGDVPAAVHEAATRLSDYLAETADMPAGTRSYSYQIGEIAERFRADPDATGKAMQNSGAADLLRSYRRA
ncbi:MAG: hypothetical protein ED558_13850 [Oricola sp.]|nr:MAG: hypothetical protein ED558_13850 [Oricola sp.]